jgi:putative cell wall-binding protein
LPGVPKSLAGDDRVVTAIEIAAEDFEDLGAGALSGAAGGRVGASAARLRAQAGVIVAAESFADAIAAGPLAFVKRGPLLLTSGGQLDERTKTALRRLVPVGSTVYLVGGPTTLKPAVADAVTALGYVVERINGDDRYGTAVAVAERGLGAPSTVFVATGLDFPDALAAGAVAARVGAAVVLTAGDKVPASLAAYLAKYPNTTVVAVGGPASRAFPNATSVRGDDRFATAAALAMAYPATGTMVGVASGSSFPDGLASTTFLARRGGVLLLVATESVPQSTSTYLTGNRSITTTQVFGGLSVVSDSTRRALAGILTRQ